VKSKAIRVILALIVAISAGVGTFYIAQTLPAAEAPLIERREVFVANSLISKGTTLQVALDEGLIGRATYPADIVPASALEPDGILELTNLAVTEIAPGLIITGSLFLDASELAALTGVPQGLVAISHLFSSEESVAGLISRGDTVAVFATGQPQEVSADTVAITVTKMIIASAIVTQVGEKTVPEGDQDNSGTRLITLLLSPQDAALFIQASKTASLHLALLAPGSAPTVPPTVTDF